MGKKPAPRKIVPPPVVLVLFFVAGLMAQRILPFEIAEYSLILGALLILLALAETIWTIQIMRNHGEHPSYGRDTTKLVVTGPFAHSRNPLYVASIAFYVGAALMFNTWWPIFILPLVMIWIHYFIIKKEEAYLAKKFGKTYTQYTKKVKRYF